MPAVTAPGYRRKTTYQHIVDWIDDWIYLDWLNQYAIYVSTRSIPYMWAQAACHTNEHNQHANLLQYTTLNLLNYWLLQGNTTSATAGSLTPQRDVCIKWEIYSGCKIKWNIHFKWDIYSLTPQWDICIKWDIYSDCKIKCNIYIKWVDLCILVDRDMYIETYR